MGLKRTSCWINFIILSFDYDNNKRFEINRIAMEQRRQWNLTNLLPRSTLTHDTEQEASSTTIRLIKNEHRWGVREGILGQEAQRLVRMHSKEIKDIQEAHAGQIVSVFGLDCASDIFLQYWDLDTYIPWLHYLSVRYSMEYSSRLLGGLKPAAAGMELYDTTLAYPVHSPVVLGNRPDIVMDSLGD
ncbi:hypothetical protein Vadar_020110 [Vaccinium darrowii]|uniref:Uncharacterized protein n=1 Tax=Vaccinium darrowii TaxID=229202 RepID=A0ACB7Y983_9ERIC|nr:hypothetical protein Vadar_020110 [Vaccinium darrowii]